LLFDVIKQLQEYQVSLPAD